MTDTEPTPCGACHQAPATMEGLCEPCYWHAVDLELCADWLPDTPDPDTGR